MSIQRRTIIWRCIANNLVRFFLLQVCHSYIDIWISNALWAERKVLVFLRVRRACSRFPLAQQMPLADKRRLDVYREGFLFGSFWHSTNSRLVCQVQDAGTCSWEVWLRRTQCAPDHRTRNRALCASCGIPHAPSVCAAFSTLRLKNALIAPHGRVKRTKRIPHAQRCAGFFCRVTCGGERAIAIGIA